MTYQVETYQEGRWWVISVTGGLPENMVGVSQAKRLNQVEQTAQELIGDLLEIDPSSIKIDLKIEFPGALAGLLDEVDAAKARERQATVKASEVMVRTVRNFLAGGYTYREIGTALGLSHQRIKQLADQHNVDTELVETSS